MPGNCTVTWCTSGIDTDDGFLEVQVMSKEILGWGVGWAVIFAAAMCAVYLERSAHGHVAAMIVQMAGGATGVVIGASQAARYASPDPSTVHSARDASLCWVAAFLVASATFWLLLAAHGLTQVTTETRRVPLGFLPVLVAELVFGALGGLLSTWVSDQESGLRAIVRALTMTVVWAAAALIGGYVAFVGGYVLLVFSSFGIRPAELDGIVGAAGGGGLGGLAAASIARQARQRLVRWEA